MNKECELCPHRRGYACLKETGAEVSVNHIQACPIGLWPKGSASIAPFRTGSGKRWEGAAPWRDAQVSVLLPVLEYGPTLDLVLECIRRQTVKSVVYIIDTGSIQTTEKIANLRDPQTEVIQLRLQGWGHASWPVASGLDAAWSCVNTPFVFCTHDDCLLQKQTTFEELIPLAQQHIVVGHQLTERPYPEWFEEFGHTCLMYSTFRLSEMNLSWSMRNFADMNHLDLNNFTPGTIDTERPFNFTLRRHGHIPKFDAPPGTPLFIGKEVNYVRNVDAWIDHCRSTTCGFLYSPDHYAKTLQWTKDAMEDCRRRLAQWH